MLVQKKKTFAQNNPIVILIINIKGFDKGDNCIVCKIKTSTMAVSPHLQPAGDEYVFFLILY